MLLPTRSHVPLRKRRRRMASWRASTRRTSHSHDAPHRPRPRGGPQQVHPLSKESRRPRPQRRARRGRDMRHRPSATTRSLAKTHPSSTPNFLVVTTRLEHRSAAQRRPQSKVSCVLHRPPPLELWTPRWVGLGMPRPERQELMRRRETNLPNTRCSSRTPSHFRRRMPSMAIDPSPECSPTAASFHASRMSAAPHSRHGTRRFSSRTSARASPRPSASTSRANSPPAPPSLTRASSKTLRRRRRPTALARTAHATHLRVPQARTPGQARRGQRLTCSPSCASLARLLASAATRRRAFSRTSTRPRRSGPHAMRGLAKRRRRCPPGAPSTPHAPAALPSPQKS